MQLKKGKYQGLFIFDLIGDTTEKYNYFKFLLNHKDTPKWLKGVMLEMDKPSNWKYLDMIQKKPTDVKRFWSNKNRNFTDFVKQEKFKQ